MRNLLSLIIVFLVFSKYGTSQPVQIPAGYHVYKGLENNPFKLENDLDGDGKKDIVIAYAKDKVDYENILSIYLSSKADNCYSFPFNSLSYEMSVKNNVLNIGGCFGTGRYCKTLKFKYYPAIHNLRLIGYDEESFGNAMNEGAYVKSVNLLTNKYELSGAKWKKPLLKTSKFPSITIDKFGEKELEQLESLAAELL